MNTTSYRRTALALALCAMTGAAFAQSSSGSSGGSSSGGSTSGGSPSAATPMNSGTGAGNYPSSSPSGQMSPGGQPMSNGMSNGNSNAMRSPSRTDSADNAYRSLDASNRGYLQKSDVQGLSGFNFDQADTNHDGRLTKDEFSKAWATTK